MVWYFIVGALAAFGLLCILWILYGCLLGKARGGVLVCLCDGSREADLVLRYSQLRSIGLLRCPLVLLDSKLTQREQEILRRRHPSIDFCTLDALPVWLEMERTTFD